MLPLSRAARPAYRSYSFLPLYFRRIVKWQQMDIEFTFWQMLHLLVAPRIVYRQTTYHKQTKNQWARDDPAFVVITSMLVAIAATAYCISFGSSFAQSLVSIISAVCVDFLLIGLAICTTCWALANRYLRLSTGAHSHAVEQRVEWMYAFDVHCNSFFPLFVGLYVLQFFLCPLLLQPGFWPAMLSTCLYAFFLGYYHYVNFLGYNALPFLDRTETFLYPVGLIILCVPIAILSSFNPTRFVLNIYFGV